MAGSPRFWSLADTVQNTRRIRLGITTSDHHVDVRHKGVTVRFVFDQGRFLHAYRIDVSPNLALTIRTMREAFACFPR